MLMERQREAEIMSIVGDDENCRTIKRLYNKDRELSVVQVLDFRDKIYKCLFYEEGKRLSNVSLYNTKTGKEIKNITYRNDGRTISSIREYNIDTEKLRSVTFYKEDGKSLSSVVEYNSEGYETQFTLYCDDGEIIRQVL